MAVANISRNPGGYPAKRDFKVAIIGAGISGITAAINLKRLGFKNITIFEKEKKIGGKIRSIVHDNQMYELGALVANHNFKRTLHYAKQHGEHLTKTPDACLIDEDASVLTYHEFVKKRLGLASFLSSSLRFWRVLRRFPELKKAGFHDASPDLFYTMHEFGEREEIAAALMAIKPFLVSCGYGFYERVPALYLMKLAPHVLMQPFADIMSFGTLRKWSVFDRGWQDLLERMSENLDIRLSTEVSQVFRQGDGKKTSIEVRHSGSSEIFDRIIMTTSLDKTTRFLDITSEERALFTSVRSIRYLSTLVEGEKLFTAHYLSHADLDKYGHVNCIVQEHSENPVFQIYQMLNDTMTVDDALNYAHEDLKIIDGRIIKVIAQQEWSYFPHVTSKELRNGYYEALEGIQGRLGAYFCGSIFNFETVEHNICYAEDLVTRFFDAHPVKNLTRAH